MSRQTVVKSISELNEMLDEESGICGGGKKKMGGVKLAYGSGLIAAPNQYGFDPYVNGFVPPQQRGGYGIGGYGVGGNGAGIGGLLSAKAAHEAHVRAAKHNPWIEFAKDIAADTGANYKDVISNKQVQDAYHEMYQNKGCGVSRSVAPRRKRKMNKNKSLRRLMYV